MLEYVCCVPVQSSTPHDTTIRCVVRCRNLPVNLSALLRLWLAAAGTFIDLTLQARVSFASCQRVFYVVVVVVVVSRLLTRLSLCGHPHLSVDRVSFPSPLITKPSNSHAFFCFNVDVEHICTYVVFTSFASGVCWAHIRRGISP